jgi:4-hydroxy-L-threonine phosphate dehydrogenase PdxA
VAGKNENSSRGENMATRIGMMMGDPAGIGAELAARVLSSDVMSAETGVLVVGDPSHLARGQSAAGTSLDIEALTGANDVKVEAGKVSLLPQSLAGAENYPYGKSKPEGGRYMLDCFETLLALHKEDLLRASEQAHPQDRWHGLSG